VYLIQMLLQDGLGRELPYAFVECALSNGVGLVLLMRSVFSEGHFRRTAGASKLI
jgi:hypothetical protein